MLQFGFKLGSVVCTFILEQVRAQFLLEQNSICSEPSLT